MIRVVLVDDEALIRTGIRLVLETAGDIEIVGEGGDGHEAVELIHRHRPDVLLLDIRMPKLDGLTAVAEIAKLGSSTQVVMLTTFGEDEHVARALRAGAAGFLLKDTPPIELAQGVRAAAQGQAILSPQITRQVIDGYVGPEDNREHEAKQRLQVLTDREREVLVLLGGGASNAEIAQALFMGEGTVKTHVSRILAKLDCNNRVQAAILAHDARLVPPR
ncbi:response regulator transcription factor [Streptomyces sp. NPDC006475]|uniref:response regulator transcription factor n=1 Tax=Streptomyces sp. NPDC006475 TaxID=3155719 RepID=UPI0033BA7551